MLSDDEALQVAQDCGIYCPGAFKAETPQGHEYDLVVCEPDALAKYARAIESKVLAAAPAAPDADALATKEGLRQRSEAWYAVVAELDKIDTDWRGMAPTMRGAAVAMIQQLGSLPDADAVRRDAERYRFLPTTKESSTVGADKAIGRGRVPSAATATARLRKHPE
jgi:hypothetical protein